MIRLRTTAAALLLAATAVVATAGVASADTISPTKSISKSGLSKACAIEGGGSYGGQPGKAYGCTNNHPDGSADTVECYHGKCTHYHWDAPARIKPGTKTGVGAVPVGVVRG